MNVLVCVKRVPLTGGKIVLTDDAQAISTRHLGFTISPHEECGAEEAVRLIEQHGGSSAVLTLGPPEAEEQLRDLMAIGVDRGVHLVTDGSEWDAQATHIEMAKMPATRLAFTAIDFVSGARDATAAEIGRYAGAGPSIGKHILMTYLPPEQAVAGTELAVEYMGERYPVTVVTNDSTPVFDPDNSRVRS